MSSKKKSVVWEAAPHTIAKIEILKAYLTAWFPILGRSKRNQELLYIDGFAGPGEYLNYPSGSPIIALETARNTLASLGRDWIAGQIHLAFIDHDVSVFKHLREKIGSYAVHKRIHLHFYNETFTKAIAKLKDDVSLPFVRSHPLFAFIDPFGATGVPFSTVSKLLRSTCSEVLINLDADGIARIFSAGDKAAYERNLNLIFDSFDWQTKGWEMLSAEQQCNAVLEFYKKRLRELPNVKYVFAFEMRTTKRAINYYLVFASQHYLGLEKMKEAMKRMDQDGTYSFSDARAQQPLLFRFDDPQIWSDRMFAAFRGKGTLYSEVNDFALNETPFINPKKMLSILEDSGHITIESSDPKRKKGTFNPEKIIRILFTE